MFTVALYLVAAAATVISLVRDRKKTAKALRIASNSFFRILPDFGTVLALVGIMLTFLSPAIISAVLGRQSGLWGMLAAAIFVLLGLLEVWVPRETVIRFLGEKSGAIGVILSFVLGAAAAGPLYAAFPVAATMLRKGAKFTNVLILLYAWSTLKLPMFLFETSALGADFSVTRMLLNISGIVALAWLTNVLVSQPEKEAIYLKHAVQGGPA